MNSIEDKAHRLFIHNHPDAQPALAELAWTTDPEIRAFWIRQIEVVFEVTE